MQSQSLLLAMQSAVVFAVIAWAVLHGSTAFHGHYNSSNLTSWWRNERNHQWGRRGDGDRLLYQARAYHTFSTYRNYYHSQSSPSVRYGFWGKVTLDLDFPAHNHRPLGTISFIEVLHMSGAKASYICITKGGVGHRFVTVHLESLFNCGLDYAIRIYGPNC